MRITQLRDNGKTQTYRVFTLEKLMDQIKHNADNQLLIAMKEELKYVRPDYSLLSVQKVPKILPSAVFRKKDGMVQLVEYNGIVQLEVNHLAGKHEVELVKQKVSDFPQTLAAFAGSGGKSVKIWVRFTRPDDTLPELPEEIELFQAHAYRQAFRIYQPELKFNIELKEPKLERYCRLTSDPDLYFAPNATPLYLQQPAEMPMEMTYKEAVTAEPQPLKRLLPGFSSYKTMSVLFEASLTDALNALTDFHSNKDMKPLLVRLGENCFRSGIPEDDAVRWARYHYYHEEHEMLIRNTLHNVYLKANGFGKKPCIGSEMAMAVATEEFMKRRYEFRYNTQTTEVEYRERNTFCFYFKPVTERVLNSIAINAMKEGLKLWDRDVKRYVNSDSVPIYQPIEEYLSFLPRWDGKDRIRALADTVPCSNLYWRDLFYRWFLNMVAHWRGFDKKHANSTSPLLVGEQGFKKSTFCRSIVPPELRQYYTDSIDFSRKRDAELFLNRFALINIDEFDQITPTQQAFLKHILQKPVVNTRRPHAHAVQELRRYASFIGTSNHKDLLTDTSGSRRFICIEVADVIDMSQPIHYEQLYSQAMDALYSGERYWFDSNEERLMTENNEEFQEVSPLEQLFHQYFRSALKGEEGEWLLAVGILEHIQQRSCMRLTTGKIIHFGRLLSKIGVPSRRSNGGTIYYVVKKE
ncbi:BT4734/BF3469 family protein [uncultured Bacteroides sp.]|uniref:BT4734/BF3469 family protein n=1 Tax=uncultured Bacteroides sp. TaxID=162156 RepID=UPI002AA61CC1|nr:BT4734/BF3469 family protein [uncultured Bacteroides sp.]